jgi:hypothetical protein
MVRVFRIAATNASDAAVRHKARQRQPRSDGLVVAGERRRVCQCARLLSRSGVNLAVTGRGCVSSRSLGGELVDPVGEAFDGDQARCLEVPAQVSVGEAQRCPQVGESTVDPDACGEDAETDALLDCVVKSMNRMSRHGAVDGRERGDADARGRGPSRSPAPRQRSSSVSDAATVAPSSQQPSRAARSGSPITCTGVVT